MTWKQTLIAAVVLALVAAAVVWWLERYNGERMIAEMQRYLRKQDDFNAQYPEVDDV